LTGPDAYHICEMAYIGRSSGLEVSLQRFLA